MSKRSTWLIVVGVAVFVLGAGLVVISLHGGSSNSKGSARLTAAGGATSSLVVTTGPVTAGTSGESLIESKKVTIQSVPVGQIKPADVTSLAALEQQSLVHSLPSGTVIQASDLSPDAGPLAPPKGDESIAVTLPNGASGLAGYLQPGSDVDIYANVTKTTTGPAAVPCVTLVASRVPVLDVSDVVPAYRTNPSSGGRAVPSSITVLLGVTPAQAPGIVYYAANEQMYLTASNQATATPSGTCVGLKGGALVPVQ